MILCDLCGKTKECRQREIEGKEYDICSECWKPLAQKLKGKGRVKKESEMVLLPPTTFLQPETKQPELPEPKPSPGAPPKIWGSLPQ
jgi:hypothetical protein